MDLRQTRISCRVRTRVTRPLTLYNAALRYHAIPRRGPLLPQHALDSIRERNRRLYGTDSPPILWYHERMRRVTLSIRHVFDRRWYGRVSGWPLLGRNGSPASPPSWRQIGAFGYLVLQTISGCLYLICEDLVPGLCDIIAPNRADIKMLVACPYIDAPLDARWRASRLLWTERVSLSPYI